MVKILSASAFAIHFLIEEAKGKNTDGHCEKTLKKLTATERNEVFQFLQNRKIEAQRELDVYTKSISQLNEISGR